MSVRACNMSCGVMTGSREILTKAMPLPLLSPSAISAFPYHLDPAPIPHKARPQFGWTVICVSLGLLEWVQGAPDHCSLGLLCLLTWNETLQEACQKAVSAH